jgi:plasmid stability protein
MHTVTVKNIPNDLYEKLKRSAHANRRSINSEIIMCIERAVRSRRIRVDDLLPRIEALDEKVSLPPLTDDILEKAIDEGRA